ncbi:type II toxin-antitoxin system RelE/ParE family toxin [uncultured Treponema sp.]|uniref:type II toxin-antitoxin system RelE/ParE family toxin n=1 Tax=uncultured Treponema sp. TaxID=162155 RepID=UPI0025D2424A|nr:type II toxin-antitoxin system RelE/ParE family toxin [uncultured Treponema sp.]
MYEVLQTKLFSKWLKKLKDNIAKIAIVRRLGRLENGNFGDSKFVGDSVFELRIDVGKGYRIYFTNKEKEIVILLVGGEKSTQDEDIKKAKEMAKEV